MTPTTSKCPMCARNYLRTHHRSLYCSKGCGTASKQIAHALRHLQERIDTAPSAERSRVLFAVRREALRFNALGTTDK